MGPVWAISASPRTISPISGSPFLSPLLLDWPPVMVFGVGQPVISACAGSAGDPHPFVFPSVIKRALRAFFVSHFSLAVSLAFGVCHPANAGSPPPRQ